MQLINVRRIFYDGNHNAFTDICFFKGNYYVTFRTSTRHVCPDGRVLVLRGLDGGTRWMAVASIYSGIDTRDPKFMIKDDQLFVYAFSFRYVDKTRVKATGYAVTTDGDFWTPWQKIEDDWVYWAPEWFNGKAYVVAYREADKKTMLKVSDDGVKWKDVCVVSEDGYPNETSLVFMDDGTLRALIRREGDSGRPFLSRSAPPYTKWEHNELDHKIQGPLLWRLGDELWACGRWYQPSGLVNTAVFKIQEKCAVPQVVLPSAGDTSYAGIVRKQDTENRYLLSYYSEHEAPMQWRQQGAIPAGIYLAELELP